LDGLADQISISTFFGTVFAIGSERRSTGTEYARSDEYRVSNEMIMFFPSRVRSFKVYEHPKWS